MAGSFNGFDIADGAPSILPGRYAGSIRDIEQMVARATGDPFLVWRCVVDVDGENVEVDGSSSLNTSPRSKPRRWMRAVLGREIEKGEHVAKSELLDRPCHVDVDINDDGWPYVEDIRPADLPPPPRSTPAKSFREDFAAKSRAAQAQIGDATPPVGSDKLPF